MAKRIDQIRDHSGTETKLYILENNIIEVKPYFLYEICFYKYGKNEYSQIESIHFNSNKLLKIKKSSIYKKYNGYIFEKNISIVGAPSEFIRKNNLPEYKPIIKKKK